MVLPSPLQMERELGELRQDWRSYRAQGWSSVLRERPAKGLRRSVLIAGWLTLHAFEAVAITVYGLPWGPSGAPKRTVLWLLITSLAGLQYVRLVFSDPGFLTPEALQALADAQLGQAAVDVMGSAEARGEMELAVEECRGGATSVGRGGAMAPVEEETSEGMAGAVGVEAVTVRLEEGRPRVAAAGGRGGSGGADAGRVEGGVERGDGGQERAEDGGAEEEEEGAGEGGGEEDDAGGLESGRTAPPGCGVSVEGSGLGLGGARVLEDEGAGVRLDTDGEPMSKERAFWEEREELTKDNRDKTGMPEIAARYFDGYSEDAGCLLPIRAKWVKKHARVVSKFDHYCYCLGNSVGELNHGAFWRLLALQLASIWTAKALVDHAYVHTAAHSAASLINLPLLLLDALSWIVGIPLTILFCMHSFMALTSSTTHEFMKVEKLQYLKGFYEFSCPFSEGLWLNLRHFCCPRGLRLWERPLPEREWPETCWRNRYYTCFG